MRMDSSDRHSKSNLAGSLTWRAASESNGARLRVAHVGKIKSARIKKKSARSGIRLIDFDSIRQFLRTQTK
jgi:hypothetical protein